MALRAAPPTWGAALVGTQALYTATGTLVGVGEEHVMGKRGRQPNPVRVSGLMTADPALPALTGLGDRLVICHMAHVTGLRVLENHTALVAFQTSELASLVRAVRLPAGPRTLSTADVAALLRVEALLRGESTNHGEEHDNA